MRPVVCLLHPLALLPAALPDGHGGQSHGGPPRLVVCVGHIHPMVTENVTNNGPNSELFVCFFFIFIK